LGGIGSETKATVPALIEALEDKSAYVRSDAASALVQFGLVAVHALLEVLKDEDVEARRQAASALVQFGLVAVPALIEALKDKDVVARRQAAYALGRIGPEAKAAVPALKSMRLNDSLNFVRQSADSALKKISK
jgi:HEAT repeat protein